MKTKFNCLNWSYIQESLRDKNGFNSNKAVKNVLKTKPTKHYLIKKIPIISTPHPGAFINGNGS
jgi:hypothetical protein